MFRMLHYLIALLLLLPIFLKAQFPTSSGTKWEYFQFFEDVEHPSAVLNSFQDEVVGDTVAGGVTFHVVRRTGWMYNGSGFPSSSDYDTVDGTWYYRVQGTQVWVLDSVSAGTPYESLLYEFGLGQGDSIAAHPRNLIELTAFPRPQQYDYLSFYSFDTVCSLLGNCSDPWTLDYWSGVQPVLPACSLWNPNRNICFLPGIGTIFSNPYMVTLDVYGQYYYLRELTSGGQQLYVNPFIATAVDGKMMEDFATLYPNPAQERVRISSSLPLTQVRMIDIQSVVVQQFNYEVTTLTQELDVKGLPRGLYFVVITTENRISSHSVILR